MLLLCFDIFLLFSLFCIFVYVFAISFVIFIFLDNRDTYVPIYYELMPLIEQFSTHYIHKVMMCLGVLSVVFFQFTGHTSHPIHNVIVNVSCEFI